MISGLIIAIYALGVAAFFVVGWPVWPFLLLGCAALACYNPRAALVFAVGVVLVRIIHAQVTPQEYLWAYYATTYATIGFISLAFWDRFAGAACFAVALGFSTRYAGAPIDISHGLAELAYVAGMVGAVNVGPRGGILSGIRWPSNASSNRGSLGGRGVRSRAGGH